MKKMIFLVILIGTTCFALDEERICTLIERNGTEIPERKAKTLNKYEKVMIKTETKLYLEDGECLEHKYDHTSSLGIDNYKGVYDDDEKGIIIRMEGFSIFSEKKNIYKCITTTRELVRGEFLYVTYTCREANFLEKGKIKSLKLLNRL